MVDEPAKILVIDDDEDILLAATLLLKQSSFQVHTEKDPRHLPQRLQHDQYDCILLDMNFSRDAASGAEGLYWLEKIMTIDPQAIVILMTAYSEVDLAVKAMKAGAIDFISKPWQNEKLLATLSLALNLRATRRQVDVLRTRQQQLSNDIDQQFHDMIGTCPAMNKVFQVVEKVAGTDASVLILGENGAGKELIARALHRLSSRREEIFIAVDMGSIPETLFESELFGFVKGAFTDAKRDKAGRFEAASGGTLFLDEIGNIPLSMQAKLLRVLEEKQVMRLGATQPRAIDIRLICASNVPLYELVKRKEFRQDFLYRINTVEITLPPLREREQDIPLLIDHYLRIYCRRYKKEMLSVSSDAMAKLTSYSWPGNVRELRHAMERAVILAESPVLQPADFMFAAAEPATEGISFDAYNLEEIEKSVIRQVLIRRQGNISRAAAELGITRTSLYRRMEKHGL